ncbi:MAG: hypothetical protein IIA66_10180 [Planctomycetes bacterium]|nr:hypothetical protein [Planctomycetota bacterium]
MNEIDWKTLGAIIGVMVPLLGVPLAMITLYLKSIRDYQVDRCEGIEDRLEHLDAAFHDVRRRVGEFERDYTTKEEWLRESMHARKQLEKLTELVTRIQVGIENGNGLAHHFAQATEAMVRLTEALVAGRN